MRSVAWLVLAVVLGGSIPRDAHAQSALDAQRKAYADLLVTIGDEALRQPRLALPLPCFAHWLAGSDRIVVGVSTAGTAAGLAPGDSLARIGGRDLTGRKDGPWDAAMRALQHGKPSYVVDVDRRGKRVRLVLPCAADGAKAVQQAEQMMWTAVTRREWDACVMQGEAMLAAFGAAMSPPLLVMTQCATASGMPSAKLTAALARALLAEMVAHPEPQPDLREQLFLTLRQLEAMQAAGDEDYATELRAEMTRLGVVEPKDR